MNKILSVALLCFAVTQGEDYVCNPAKDPDCWKTDGDEVCDRSRNLKPDGLGGCTCIDSHWFNEDETECIITGSTQKCNSDLKLKEDEFGGCMCIDSDMMLNDDETACINIKPKEKVEEK